MATVGRMTNICSTYLEVYRFKFVPLKLRIPHKDLLHLENILANENI